MAEEKRTRMSSLDKAKKDVDKIKSTIQFHETSIERLKVTLEKKLQYIKELEANGGKVVRKTRGKSDKTILKEAIVKLQDDGLKPDMLEGLTAADVIKALQNAKNSKKPPVDLTGKK